MGSNEAMLLDAVNQLGTGLYYLAAFVVIISIIVFIHEFGHYIVAKWCGVKIEVFSIGFGKEIFGWNDKSGTRWKVSWVPAGGYVKMFGDINPASLPDKDKMKKLTKEDEKQAFHSKSLPQKAAIVAAGPIANFLLGIVILTFFYSFYGKPVTLPEITAVIAESAAEKAGLKEHDLIVDIDGSEIDTFSDIQRIIALNTGTPVNITVERQETLLTITLTPTITERKDVFGNVVKVPLIGIESNKVTYENMNVAISAWEATKETYIISATTLKAIGQMITGKRGTEEISGPIRIAKYSGQVMEMGLTSVLWFIVVISINLGLINLFPIPVLDGGHLMYYAVEAIKGKPMAEKYQEWGFKFGLVVIGMLALFAIYNDITNI